MSAVLLDDVYRFIRRFVVLEDHQADTVTLWAAATHAFEAFACTPYLAISSAEKRSGKSLLLDVLALLVRDPLPTANISDAALFRAIEDRKPTLLIDEIDTIFGRKARDREELRGILNAGYRRGAVTHRMGGSNNTKLERFSVYCPKAFAGIGGCLPDTIADRAIPIRLKRRTREEPVNRFRLPVVEPEGLNLRDRLGEWLEPYQDYLAEQWPELPDQLDDRAQDVWEALLAVAEIGGWSERARAAAVALMTGAEREDDSITFALIRDIGSVERFINEVRGDDPELACCLRIEERELETGGLNERRVAFKRGVPASVNHLALAVSDQARSTRFYIDYFGFVPEPEPRADGVLILHDASGFSLALGEIDEPVVLPPFLHFGRSAVGPDDVRSFRDRVKADGLDVVEWWEEPDYVSVKFRDPDGYVIEVGWDAARPDRA